MDSFVPLSSKATTMLTQMFLTLSKHSFFFLLFFLIAKYYKHRCQQFQRYLCFTCSSVFIYAPYYDLCFRANENHIIFKKKNIYIEIDLPCFSISEKKKKKKKKIICSCWRVNTLFSANHFSQFCNLLCKKIRVCSEAFVLLTFSFLILFFT